MVLKSDAEYFFYQSLKAICKLKIGVFLNISVFNREHCPGVLLKLLDVVLETTDKRWVCRTDTYTQERKLSWLFSIAEVDTFLYVQNRVIGVKENALEREHIFVAVWFRSYLPSEIAAVEAHWMYDFLRDPTDSACIPDIPMIKSDRWNHSSELV